MSHYHDERNSGSGSGRSGHVPHAYVDGSARCNGQPNARAGYGVHWTGNEFPDSHAPLSPDLRQTNNNAEIRGANEAIRQARDAGYTEMKLTTDSKFVKDAAEKWVPGWADNGWKKADGQPVQNKSEFQEMHRLQQDVNVEWDHVRGHSGNQHNERADQLARQGADGYYSHRYESIDH